MKMCANITKSYRLLREKLSLKDVGVVMSHYLPHVANTFNIHGYDQALAPIVLLSV